MIEGMNFAEKESNKITFNEKMLACTDEDRSIPSDNVHEPVTKKDHLDQTKKPYFGWLYLLVTFAALFLWHFIEGSRSFGYVIFVVAIAAFIAFIVTLSLYLKSNKSTTVETGEEETLTSEESVLRQCHAWYEDIKGECTDLRAHDSHWNEAVFLQCVLIECDRDLLQNEQRIKPGDKIVLVREYSDTEDKNAISVNLEDGTLIGHVCRMSNAIPAGLMNSGMDLISRVYKKKLFPYLLCIVAEIYINDQKPLNSL